MKWADRDRTAGDETKKKLANYNGCFLGRLPTGSSQSTKFKLALYVYQSFVLELAISSRDL
jgi:hypothetical protein